MSNSKRRAITGCLYIFIGLIVVSSFAASTWWEMSVAGIAVIVASVLIQRLEREK